MTRGDIYRVRDPEGDPRSHRSFVVVSRQAVIDSRFSTVICAPVFTRGLALESQLRIGIAEGMKQDCWIVCDNLASVNKAKLTHFVGSLSRSKLEELDE